MDFQFTAFPRQTQGSGASRRLRRAGKVPGIVYGGASTPTQIELDHNALFHALKHEAFHSHILTMTLAGKPEQVLLRDVQWHPYKQQVLHIDFQRIDASQQLHKKVPLHFVNAELSAAVKLGGAIISHIMNEIEVKCLPKDLPEFIEVDLANITVGHSLHVSDLKLPAGVQFIPHGQDTNPVVVAAIVPRGNAQDETTAATTENPAGGTTAS